MGGGASYLDATRSLLVQAFIEERLQSHTINQDGLAFTQLGFSARVDGCGASRLRCPASIDWGLEAIDGMKTPADDPSLGCGLLLAQDRKAPFREACSFTSGVHAEESLGISKLELARIPIRHVIVAMKENRSFDPLFGKLHDQGQPGVDALPTTFANPDANGKLVWPFHEITTCVPFDPGHQSASVKACVNRSKIDGFLRSAAATTPTDGSFVIGNYESTDLPFHYWLASTFAIADRDFAPALTGTFANRNFMLFGTSAGVVDTGVSYPAPNTPSIFHSLMSAGFTWGSYFYDPQPLSGTLGWDSHCPGVHSTSELYDALDKGTLPNVAFVDDVENVEDDHPTGDLQFGEAWLKRLYDHAITSPQWPGLVIVYTYDEAGGFADHVPPPDGCAPVPSRSLSIARGPRVALVAISPWSKRGFVSHVVRDHASITRFIETLFDLPALTAREANADALLDMFDFSCGRDLAVGTAPAAGTGGCKP